MRTKLIILFGLISQISYAQLSKFIGTWITPHNELLEVRDTTNKYGNSNYLCVEGRDEGMSIFLFGDTLSFQKRYYSSATNYEKLYVDRYDLKILNFNDTTLVVKPVSQLSKKFFKDKDTLNFTQQEYAIDKEIVFEKIIFHTSSCYGECPTYHLLIEKDKSVQLFAEEVYINHPMYETDSSKIGFFEGKLDEENLNQLVLLLRTCNLDNLEFDGAESYDGSIITIIIYYNGRRKYLKSMFPPVIANKLISFLYNICDETEFERTDKKLEIEK